MNSRKTLRLALLCLLTLSILVVGTIILSTGTAAKLGQPGNDIPVWFDVNESLLSAPAGTRVIVPSRYRTVALDAAALRTLLAAAPMEFTPQAQAGGRVEVSLPCPTAEWHASSPKNRQSWKLRLPRGTRTSRPIAHRASTIRGDRAFWSNACGFSCHRPLAVGRLLH